jgi:hypothetical protein
MRRQVKNKRSFGFGHGLVALSAMFASGATVVGCGGSSSRGGGGTPPSASTTAPITSAGMNGVEVTSMDVASTNSTSLSSVQIENDLNAGFQLLVDGTYDDNGTAKKVDITRDAVYGSSDEAVALVSNQGLITPVGAGAANVTIRYTSKDGQELASQVAVQVSAPTGTNPNFVAIEVLPPARSLAWVDPAAGTEQLQQVVIYATDDQNVIHDLTRSMGVLIQDDQGDPTVLGSVDPNGLFRGVSNGKVWVIARLQAEGLVAGAELVLGTGVASPVNPNQLYSGAPLAGSTNELDKAVLDNLFRQFIEPAPLASDGEFLRRLYADALDRIPTEAETDAFLADTDAAKWEKEVDKVLADPQFATKWGNLMAEWLEMASEAPAFATWAETQITAGATVADMFQEVIKGNVAEFETIHDDAAKKAGIVMLTGTGQTAECATCHDDPLAGPNDALKWTQAEFYPIVAFFAENAAEATAFDGVTNTRVGNPYDPGFAPSPTATVTTTLNDPVQDRRDELSTVFTASSAFFRGMSHRIFSEVASPLMNPNGFSRQAQIDTITVPNVLATIEALFVNENCSIQGFLRQVFTSQWYGMTSDATDMDVAYDGLLQRHMVRRHHAEFMIDAFGEVTGTPVAAADLDFIRETWGFPATRETIAERSDAVNMSQSLVIQNSPIVQDKIAGAKITGIASDVDGGTITQTAAITKIWHIALNRDPSTDEITCANDTIGSAGSTEEGLQDVLSALMSSIEFSMR